MSDLLRAKLNDHIVIFDGAMGTELYNRNFFLNSCYENLNLTNPDAVLGIHVAYFDSGAEVLTTNTYGANRLKLSRHGLAEQIGEINRAGVHLARRAGDETTLVAGSVGPLGREQMSGHSQEELIEVFGEQIGYLQSAGADFILGESMPSLSDARLFLKAVEKYSDIPYMISFATDRDLTLAFGEDLAPFMNEIKALSKAPTAIGLNCGIGPEPMLAALEKLVKVSPYPIIAQPNAGVPKSIDNRTIYMCSPEYLTTYAIRFVSLGVRGVGGCCGTTPEHIFDLARSVRPMRHTPPRGFSLDETIAKAAACKAAGIDAINLPDGPRASSRISSLITACEIQGKAGIETILHCCCRDKNLIAMQADLLGCARMGVTNILFITGDPPKLGDYPFASGVFDVDSIGILKVASAMNRGLDIGGRSIGKVPTGFFAGAGVDPNAIDITRELNRMREKAEAGANFFITQPIFSIEPLDVVLKEAAKLNIPVIAGVWPLASYRNAEFMQNEVPGVVIPESVMRRMGSAESKSAQLATGIEIARETIAAIRDRVAGVQVSAPFGKVETALAVLEGI